MMNELLMAMLPEIALCGVACFLFLLGTSTRTGARKASALIALLTLFASFVYLFAADTFSHTLTGAGQTVIVGPLAIYIKLLASGVGCILVLMAWPSSPDGQSGSAVSFGQETSEFFGLMLLSIAGLFTVASANDMILLFLGIELASIPTYIMVSVSRPLPVAQEAGVKYFFLGAMSAAVMLFGFSYLYGSTGEINLSVIAQKLSATRPGETFAPVLTGWQTLAGLLLLAGFAFKIAAVPLHVYAGDVYQGAATPVTAFLAFVPKASGFVAVIKLLFVLGGGTWHVPPAFVQLLWVLAVLSMSFGNVLALLQQNVKRVLAYSSVAHTGYMLVGLATLLASINPKVQGDALSGVLFYLAAYGLMNAGAFGVLMLLPSRENKPATTAETFDDLAGQGRKHVALGLAMAVSCFSLIGLPLTVGFFGKILLIKPALDARLYWLVVITMLNAAVSAAYYLRIIAAMFLRPLPEAPSLGEEVKAPAPVVLAVVVSVAGSLLLGTVFPLNQILQTRTANVANAPGLMSSKVYRQN